MDKIVCTLYILYIFFPAPVEDLWSRVLLVHPRPKLRGPHPHLPPESALPRGETGRGGVLEGGRKRVLHTLRGRKLRPLLPQEA